MHLFLDDIRYPRDVTITQGFPFGKQWFIVRNIEQFKEVIDSALGEIEHIAFDHDLGPDHYKALTLHDDGKTGLDCAKYLVDKCLEEDRKLPNFSCHSMNPAGREAILFLLNRFKRFQIEGK